MADSIPLFEISWDEQDILNVVDSVGRGSYWAKGPYVEEFEDRLSAYLDVEHAKVVNSGTTALVTLLNGLGIGSGDEVVVPSFTFVATANAVRLAGGTPVFADIERDTYGLDPKSVESVLSPDTAAIMPVHVYGQTFKVDELKRVADTHGVALLEDAAAALGSTSNGQKAGTFGRAGIFSFCQNKVVATGEGGAVVTDDSELAHQVELYRSHGRSSADYFDTADSGQYDTLGTNYRMPDIVAALGCSQLEKIDSLIDGRRSAARRMNEGIERIPGVEPPSGVTGRHVYQLYTVTLDRSLDRQPVIEGLDDRGIASKIYWDPLHEYPQFEGAHIPDGGLPVTEEIASRVLSLPIHPELDCDETDSIVNALAEVVEQS